jgi:gamma-glutamyl hydrolase
MTSMRINTFILSSILALCVSHIACESLRKPVIGILSTPSDFHNIYDPKEFSYIKGAYAEFIEAADATPIGIPWDLPEGDLLSVLDSINGILLTGGDASLWEFDIQANNIMFSNFTKRTAFILRYAIHLNDKGIHFPVYGICQGHEVIVMGLAERPHVIDHFVHPGQLDTVAITSDGLHSRMFGNMPDHPVDFIKDRRSMFYNHRYGFNSSLHDDNYLINDFFKVTAKAVDDNGKEFIAAMEANDYPIYTVQYHPERVLSEWKNKTHFDHPDEAAQAVLVQAMFLVSEAKKNQQEFVSDEALGRFLLSNHEQVYFNVTWPRVHFYDKKSPISYHVNPAWSDYSDLQDYDCKHHDCSFISMDL